MLWVWRSLVPLNRAQYPTVPFPQGDLGKIFLEQPENQSEGGWKILRNINWALFWVPTGCVVCWKCDRRKSFFPSGFTVLKWKAELTVLVSWHTGSPLHTSFQVADFLRCEWASAGPITQVSSCVWCTLSHVCILYKRLCFCVLCWIELYRVQ